jgi:predicted RNase H-like HicB family nuclease
MKFKAIFTKEETGYSIRVPVLDGCYTQSETIEEGIDNLKELIPSFFNVVNDVDELEENETICEIEISEDELEKDAEKYQLEKLNKKEKIK